jgi:hypothetical protein
MKGLEGNAIGVLHSYRCGKKVKLDYQMCEKRKNLLYWTHADSLSHGVASQVSQLLQNLMKC